MIVDFLPVPTKSAGSTLATLTLTSQKHRAYYLNVIPKEAVTAFRCLFEIAPRLMLCKVSDPFLVLDLGSMAPLKQKYIVTRRVWYILLKIFDYFGIIVLVSWDIH